MLVVKNFSQTKRISKVVIHFISYDEYNYAWQKHKWDEQIGSIIVLENQSRVILERNENTK